MLCHYKCGSLVEKYISPVLAVDGVVGVDPMVLSHPSCHVPGILEAQERQSGSSLGLSRF